MDKRKSKGRECKEFLSVMSPGRGSSLGGADGKYRTSVPRERWKDRKQHLGSYCTGRVSNGGLERTRRKELRYAVEDKQQPGQSLQQANSC